SRKSKEDLKIINWYFKVTEAHACPNQSHQPYLDSIQTISVHPFWDTGHQMITPVMWVQLSCRA
ncbi:hypothetical protein J6590_065315, partial [Homalodisca vitripennis]